MRLVKHFMKKGTPLKASLIEEDLGISSGAGRKRAVRALNARIAIGKRRAQQGQRLSRANDAAAKLYRTGVAPAQEYGHQCSGVPPTTMRALRSSAVRSLPPHGHKAMHHHCHCLADRWPQ